jgi:hypothetical protein
MIRLPNGKRVYEQDVMRFLESIACAETPGLNRAIRRQKLLAGIQEDEDSPPCFTPRGGELSY